MRNVQNIYLFMLHFLRLNYVVKCNISFITFTSEHHHGDITGELRYIKNKLNHRKLAANKLTVATSISSIKEQSSVTHVGRGSLYDKLFD